MLTATDPPFYAIFFVLAGAGLNLGLVPSMGLLGMLYVVSRAIGKFTGARAGARWLDLGPTVERFLGFALITQAGLAVALTMAIEDRFVEYAPVVSTVVLSAVVVFEVIGPACTRFALIYADEARPPTAVALP